MAAVITEVPEHRVYKNVLRMLKTRKWNVPDALSAQEYDKIRPTTDYEIIPICHHMDDSERILIIFFSFVDKLRKSHIDRYVATMGDIGATDGLIVYKNETTPTARTEVSRNELELIHYSQMYRCILDHHLVPRYELVSNEKNEELDRKYGLDKIPRMFVTDPIARYYQAQVGDIFRIVRKNNQTILEVYYRRIVENTSRKNKK